MAQHNLTHLSLVCCRALGQQVLSMLQRKALLLAQLDVTPLCQLLHILKAPASLQGLGIVWGHRPSSLGCSCKSASTHPTHILEAPASCVSQSLQLVLFEMLTGLK